MSITNWVPGRTFANGHTVLIYSSTYGPMFALTTNAQSKIHSLQPGRSGWSTKHTRIAQRGCAQTVT